MEQTEAVKPKIQFGTIAAIAGKTPLWAQMVFRIVFLLTTVTTFLVASLNSIPVESKVEIITILKGVDMLIYGLSKMFGVPVSEGEGGSAVIEKPN